MTEKRTEKRTAIIIGAGPAGLTAAHELLERTDVKPIVLEMSTYMGGIARTINYKGNRIDIGGHRFFSKSDRVMDWWNRVMPIEGVKGQNGKRDVAVSYQNKTRTIEVQADGPDPDREDIVMLVRSRLSRIYFLRKFFNYPLTLDVETMKNLGPVRLAKIGTSYVLARVRPREEKTLEDFFINRFGYELYATFFRDYTEKVWGVQCSQMSAEWGAQRVKGLSITAVLTHALKKLVSSDASIAQKNVETSLIERFLYPKLGPGQMWELVARRVQDKGGEVLTERVVEGLSLEGSKISAVHVRDTKSGEQKTLRGDYVFSTMPVRELIGSMRGAVPARVKKIASELQYRDFITVGLLVNKLKLKARATAPGRPAIVPDNWIYIQEPDVKVGRLQIFNNWSPYMVSDPSKVWIGLEYFCNEGDALWSMDDAAFAKMAIAELAKIDIIEADQVVDHTVIRVPKTYPSYTGSYDQFAEVRAFTDTIENLFLIGRNGMHRYNNQDHSMLTAMLAVDNILAGDSQKANIWEINTEDEYHEEKKA
jgi:protoporphyrinogen oxidase